MKRTSGGKGRLLVQGCELARKGAGSECIYKIVADSSPDWEYITDAKVRLIYSSPSCEPITGLTSEQVTADPEAFYRIVHPDDLPVVLKHDSTLAGPKDPSELEFRIIHPTEGERWVGHVCSPLFDAEGRFIGRRGTLRDITPRRQAERMLQMARTVLDHVDDMAFIVAEDGHPIYVNDAACRAHGYTREEFLKVKVHNLDAAGGPAGHWAAYWDQVRRAGRLSYETEARRKDGTTFPVDVAVRYVEFEGRGYHCGFLRDITQRREAERRLHLTQTILDHVGDMAFIVAGDGRIIYANDSACRTYGYSRDELLNLKVKDIEASGLIADWPAWWAEMRRAGNRTFETTSRTKDGRIFPIEVGVTHVAFEGEEYHCSFSRDISSRKEAESALAESEFRFRAMANTVPDMLYTNRPDGFCDYVNQHACDYTGMTLEELVGGGWMKAYHPQDIKAGRARWEKAIRTGSPFAMEMRARAADGSYRWCMNRAIPIRGAEGRITRWFGAVTDIHDLKVAQDQLRDAQVTLEDKVRQRTAALQGANAALRAEIAERRRLEQEVLRISEWEQRRIGQDLHDDLCQQLAGIAYLCDSVKPEIRAQSPGATTKVRRIRDLLNRALADARGMARGLSPLNLESRGLKAALKDLAGAARTSSGVECRIACDDSLVRGDSDRATHVYRIVQEAMHNAIRHGKAKSIRITLRAMRRGFRLAIEDDGRGVPRRPRRTSGMGLGSMQYRAHAMGGTFAIRRRPGRRGTIVVCDVPLSEARAAAAAAARAPGRKRASA